MNVPQETHGLFDRTTRRLSIASVDRIHRRSFITRLGQGAMAISLGRLAGEALLSRAVAHSSCSCGVCTSAPNRNCCGANSIKCGNLPGHNSNSCPSGSSKCGCWSEPDSSCPNGYIELCDCCGGCGTPADCTCYLVNGTYHPSCCRHKFYTGGSGNGCDHIKCRTRLCGNYNAATTC